MQLVVVATQYLLLVVAVVVFKVTEVKVVVKVQHLNPLNKLLKDKQHQVKVQMVMVVEVLKLLVVKVVQHQVVKLLQVVSCMVELQTALLLLWQVVVVDSMVVV